MKPDDSMKQQAALEELLHLVGSFRASRDRSSALLALLPAIPGDSMPIAKSEAEGINEPLFRAVALSSVAAYSSPEASASALAAALSATRAMNLHQVFVIVWHILPNLPPVHPVDLILQCVDVVRDSSNSSERAVGLAVLLVYAPRMMVESITDDLFAAFAQADDVELRSFILKALIGNAERSKTLVRCKDLFLAWFSEIGQEDDYAGRIAWDSALQLLPPHMKQEVQEAINEPGGAYPAVYAQATDPSLQNDVVVQSEPLPVLPEVQTTNHDPISAYSGISDLDSDVNPSDADDTDLTMQIDGKLDAIARSGNSWELRDLLERVAGHFTEQQQLRALDLIAQAGDSYYGGRLLSMLAPYLGLRPLAAAMDLARNAPTSLDKVSALLDLAPYTSEDLWYEAFQITANTANLDVRAWEMRLLGEHMDQGNWDEWWSLARGLMQDLLVYHSAHPALEDEPGQESHLDDDYFEDPAGTLVDWLRTSGSDHQTEIVGELLDILSHEYYSDVRAEALRNLLCSIGDQALSDHLSAILRLCESDSHRQWLNAIARNYGVLSPVILRRALLVALPIKKDYVTQETSDPTDFILAGGSLLDLFSEPGKAGAGPGDVVLKLQWLSEGVHRVIERVAKAVFPPVTQVDRDVKVQVVLQVKRTSATLQMIPIAAATYLRLEVHLQTSLTVEVVGLSTQQVILTAETGSLPIIFTVRMHEKGKHTLRLSFMHEELSIAALELVIEATVPGSEASGAEVEIVETSVDIDLPGDDPIAP